MAQPLLSNLRRGCWRILPNMGELVKLQRANTFRKVWHLRSLTGNNVLYPLKDRKGHFRVASLTCWCWQTLGSLCSKDMGRSGIRRGVGGPLPGKGEHSRTTAHLARAYFMEILLGPVRTALCVNSWEWGGDRGPRKPAGA